MSATPDTTALDIAAASPAAMAHVATEGRWVTYEHLLKIDEYLLRVAAGEIDRLIIEAPIRHGKLVAHETLVATPDGFVPHGDLRPGDLVFAPDGSPVPVEAIGDDDEASWLVRFSDGEEIVTHGAHEWRVYDRSGAAKDWRILETQQIAARRYLSGARPNFQVDVVLPIKPRARDLPVDPYVLGAWLGDGSTSKGAITHHIDDELAIPYPVSSRHVHRTTGVVTTYYEGLWADLRSAGVAGDKHIPHDYLWADEASRWALLSGLIDTDGHVGKDGRVRFINCNEALIADVAHLVRSFGWRASISSAEPELSSSGIQGRQIVWTVGFTPTDGSSPARLARKARPTSKRRYRRGIVAIERVPSRPGRCIQVAGGEYLVGENLVPTHNSELVSHYFPAWWLGTKKNDQVMLLAYGDDFARDWGRKARNTLAEVGPRVFGVRVSGNSAAANWWHLEQSVGTMFSAGLGGQITGKGANLLIIDDPVKNAEEANSQTYRDKVWDWWQATSSSRLQPAGAVVLVMARWHEDDLAGRLQASQDGHPWTVLRLPAFAEEADPLGRPVGAPLCPEMYDKKALNLKKLEMGSYWFSALLQQKPAPAEGLMFKRADFRYWKGTGGESDKPQVYELKGEGEDEKTRYISASTCIEFQTVDVAASEKTTADYTVVSTWAVTPSRDLILLDVERQQFDALNVSGFLKRVSDKHDRPPMWIETFGAGRTPHKELMRAGYPVRELKVEQGSRSDKLVRSHVAWALYEAHKVYHPFGAAFLGDFEDELATFPSGRDDQVDTVSYAARLVPTIGAVHVVRQPLSKTIVGHGLAGGF